MTQAIVALTTMQDTIRRALAKYPQERGRIERAALLIAMGNVERITDEAYAVISQSRPDRVYTIQADTWRDEAGSCACEDSEKRPSVTCAHRWAVRLTLVALERQRRLDIKANLTPVELERLVRWKRRYEAQPA